MMRAPPDASYEAPAPIDFSGVAGPIDLDVTWIHGHPAHRRNTDPPIQVHSVDAHTFILRQSKAVHPEAPFMYLLFGNDRALLLDTGATSDSAAFPLLETVGSLADAWLGRHPRAMHELVVAHSHSHADHVAGDVQFAGRSGTVVVPSGADEVASFFGMKQWPEDVVKFDLGGRTLEIVGCPGHHPDAIAVFDPWTGFLLTGDSVYPGRLYVKDADVFASSLSRLVRFAATRRVTHVMGGHVEMTRRPGRDHPPGALYQPGEPPIQMAPGRLSAVANAAATVGNRRGVFAFDDFIIVHRPRFGSMLNLVRRALGHRIARLPGRVLRSGGFDQP
jgi:glyoxylase-like metal-dependent hydrolase (beta-lactamase superfamily II)